MQTPRIGAGLAAERSNYPGGKGTAPSAAVYLSRGASQSIQRRKTSRVRTGSPGKWPSTGIATNEVSTPAYLSARKSLNACVYGTRKSPVSDRISVGVFARVAYVIGDCAR